MKAVADAGDDKVEDVCMTKNDNGGEKIRDAIVVVDPLYPHEMGLHRVPSPTKQNMKRIGGPLTRTHQHEQNGSDEGQCGRAAA
jgi:hypothetical protein